MTVSNPALEQIAAPWSANADPIQAAINKYTAHPRKQLCQSSARIMVVGRDNGGTDGGLEKCSTEVFIPISDQMLIEGV